MPVNKAQIIYISHGGGPLPLFSDSSHEAMNTFLKSLSSKLHRPEAIIVFSAHWEENVVTIQNNEAPSMIYDYYGFPEESYKVTYPAKGNPSLAKRVSTILSDAGITNTFDSQRGFDHGMFVPLMLLYPEADIPCFQISLLNNLDPTAHLELGKALRPLLNENILFIGSGFSFHNLSAFQGGLQNSKDEKNDAFQDWLIQTCTTTLTPKEQESKLINWKKAPNATYCHPREEHLLPLHICEGLAQDNAQLVFDDYIAGKRAIGLRW